MGGLIGVLIGVASSVLLFGTGREVLFWLAIANTIILFWSWGVMHNHAHLNSRQRRAQLLDNMRHEGRSDEDLDRVASIDIGIEKRDLVAVPSYLSFISILANIAAIGLVIAGIVIRIG